jgi:calcineurin-like phosphoesterase family protein
MELVEPEDTTTFLGDMMINSSRDKKRVKLMRRLDELEQD